MSIPKVEEMLKKNHLKKISDYISQFGNDPKKVINVYSFVKTFEDLLLINRYFLEGKMCRTYYFLSYFGDPSTTSEEHAQVCKNDLIRLNEKGFYTFDGQNGILEKDGEKIENAQRSYLEFVCSKETFDKIYPKIENDNRLYFSFYLKTEGGEEEQVGNWERKNLTWYLDDNGEKDYCTNWHPEYFDDYLDTPYKQITNILSEQVYGMIISKKYGEYQVDKILLEYLND